MSVSKSMFYPWKWTKLVSCWKQLISGWCPNLKHCNRMFPWWGWDLRCFWWIHRGTNLRLRKEQGKRRRCDVQRRKEQGERKEREEDVHRHSSSKTCPHTLTQRQGHVCCTRKTGRFSYTLLGWNNEEIWFCKRHYKICQNQLFKLWKLHGGIHRMWFDSKEGTRSLWDDQYMGMMYIGALHQVLYKLRYITLHPCTRNTSTYYTC